MPMMLSHDTSIDYDIQGDGPFLLLINGLGFGRWAWCKQVPALSRHFRTITFDIRGEHSLLCGVADLARRRWRSSTTSAWRRPTSWVRRSAAS